MRPLFFSMLKYFTDGKEACRASIFAKQNGTIKAQNREEGGAKFVIHVRK